jgi:hypothetical protein
LKGLAASKLATLLPVTRLPAIRFDIDEIDKANSRIRVLLEHRVDRLREIGARSLIDTAGINLSVWDSLRRRELYISLDFDESSLGFRR